MDLSGDAQTTSRQHTVPHIPDTPLVFSRAAMQEFLEDRRVALEVALRRLTINAVRADAAVQADLRAFLGFPSYPGRSWLSGLDAELVRHLVRVPSNLELVLSARALTPIPLFSNLRLTMWMLLSGAAHKVSS